jgi:hypothetical protein
MARSPSGVAIGVSGDAHTGQFVEYVHFHRPFVHTAIVWLHAEEGQAMFGVSQAPPWFGMTEGQGGTVAGGVSQNHTGVPRG